jgi:hypothetical protein
MPRGLGLRKRCTGATADCVMDATKTPGCPGAFQRGQVDLLIQPAITVGADVEAKRQLGERRLVPEHRGYEPLLHIASTGCTTAPPGGGADRAAAPAGETFTGKSTKRRSPTE